MGWFFAMAVEKPVITGSNLQKCVETLWSTYNATLIFDKTAPLILHMTNNNKLKHLKKVIEYTSVGHFPRGLFPFPFPRPPDILSPL